MQKANVLIALILILCGVLMLLLAIKNFRTNSKSLAHNRFADFTRESEVPKTLSLTPYMLAYLKQDLDRPVGWGDLYSFTNKLRMYKKFRKLEDDGKLPVELKDIISQLHDHLFRWVLKGKSDIIELKKSFKGKGIVICSGDKYLRLAVHSIRAFRILGCNLPVEIFYNGPEDLSQGSIKYLNQLNNVKVVNLEDHFDCKTMDIKGWDMKPFSMLASSFAETILMDADTVFVHSPDEIFRDPGYQETGTMFFYDRTLFGYIGGNATTYLESFLPPPISESVKSSRLYGRKSNYEQEAGVVVIDKSRGLYGLVAACFMNLPQYKEELHQRTHGDKESFWLGFEMAQEPYYFVPVMSGTIGKVVRKKDYECIEGKAAHFDRDRRLFWFNDGIVDNKHVLDSEPFDYQHYGIEGQWDVLCLKDDPKPIDALSKSNLQKIVSSFERNPVEMSNPLAGAAMFNLGNV